MAHSNLYAGVAGYFGRLHDEGAAGVFRRRTDGGEWEHVLAATDGGETSRACPLPGPVKDTYSVARG